MQDSPDSASLEASRPVEASPEPLFHGLVELAAETLASPIALISVFDADGGRIVARFGLYDHYEPHDGSFCHYAQDADQVFVVLNALEDPRFAETAAVTGPAAIRFYAGAPLITPEGQRLGALCVLDRKARAAFSDSDSRRLRTIARSVTQALILRRDGLERDRLAAVAAERNQLLVQAERMAGVGTWSLDLDTHRTTWSEEVFRIHGLDPASGSPDLEGAIACYHPEDAQVLAGLIDRAGREGVGYDFQARIRRTDGSERDVRTVGAARRDADGRVVGLFGAFQDITEQVKNERFIRAVTDHLPGMIAYWDRDLRCRFANASYHEWFSLGPERMIGMTMLQLMGPDLFALNEPYIRAVLQGEPQTFERTLTKPTGEIGHTLARYIPDLSESGQVRGFYVLVSDVTALKQAEGQFQQAHAELTRVARVSALGAFSASLAHEVNQPLAAMATNAETAQRWLSRDPPDLPMALEAIARSEQNARRASEIISRMRAMVTKEPPKVADFDLNPAITEVLTLTRAEQERWSVRTAVELSPAPLMVHGDRIQIQQVVMNLILNALEAMQACPAKGRRLMIRTGVVEDGQVQVELEDRGPGISPEIADQIFDRLFTTKSGGTGLGLTISRSIIQAHGGRLWADAARPHGAVFRFRVPGLAG